MGADEPAEDPMARADFQKVIRHFVTTPHKPHESMKMARGEPTPRARKEPTSA